MVRKAKMDKIEEIEAYAIKADVQLSINKTFMDALIKTDGLYGINPSWPYLFILYDTKENRDKAYESFYWHKNRIEKVEEKAFIPKEAMTEQFQEKYKKQVEKEMRRAGITTEDIEEELKNL